MLFHVHRKLPEIHYNNFFVWKLQISFNTSGTRCFKSGFPSGTCSRIIFYFKSRNSKSTLLSFSYWLIIYDLSTICSALEVSSGRFIEAICLFSSWLYTHACPVSCLALQIKKPWDSFCVIVVIICLLAGMGKWAVVEQCSKHTRCDTKSVFTLLYVFNVTTEGASGPASCRSHTHVCKKVDVISVTTANLKPHVVLFHIYLL